MVSSFGVTAALRLRQRRLESDGLNGRCGHGFGLGRFARRRSSQRETYHEQQQDARAAAQHRQLPAAKSGHACGCDAGVPRSAPPSPASEAVAVDSRPSEKIMSAASSELPVARQLADLRVERPEILERGRCRLERALRGRGRERRTELG